MGCVRTQLFFDALDTGDLRDAMDAESKKKLVSRYLIQGEHIDNVCLFAFIIN
jgi:hypothetical protein